MEFNWYAENPTTRFDPCLPGEWCAIAIEKGGFEDPDSVRRQGSIQTDAGLKTRIYTNKTGIYPVFGDSTELADYPCPLWYADYRPPVFSSFVPFNGWDAPVAWQWSSSGYRIPGTVHDSHPRIINCDMIVTPDGRLGCDLSNYSTVNITGEKFGTWEANFIKATMNFVVIGLQNLDVAKMFRELLS